MVLFILANKETSQGVMSGKYDDRGNTVIISWKKNHEAVIEGLVGALSSEYKCTVRGMMKLICKT